MSDPATLRDEAADIRRLAIAKLDWSKGLEVIKRYAGTPETLESIVRSAENAQRGAERLEHYAAVLEARRRSQA